MLLRLRKKAIPGRRRGWIGFDPEHGKFAVAMPGTPKEEPLNDATGKIWTSSADGLTYSVSYEEFNIPARHRRNRPGRDTYGRRSQYL